MKNKKSSTKYIGSYKHSSKKKESLDCSGLGLVGLDQIQFYPNIVHLSLKNNHIADIDEFRKIMNPESVKTLEVEGNPMCEQLNYMYQMLLIFPNLERIDSVNFENQEIKSKIYSCQQNLGNRILDFLYWKSQLFKELLSVKNSNNCFGYKLEL